MSVAILIIVHILYVVKIFDNLITTVARGFITGILLSMLCWQQNTTWGIVTLCYTSILFLIFSLYKEINK